MTTHSTPQPVPPTRMIGSQDRDRRLLLACVDVVVGYVTALHAARLEGWHVEAALVESRAAFRGGDTVALRCSPIPGVALTDLAPVPMDVLRELAMRIVGAVDGIAHVVPDIASPAPDVDGAGIGFDDDGVYIIGLDGLLGELRSA